MQANNIKVYDTTSGKLQYVVAPDEYCESTSVMGVWINPISEEIEWQMCYQNGKRYVYGYIIRQKDYKL